MKKTTVEKIVKNAASERNTVIGKYTYTADLNTGDIKRCKTEDVDRVWIDCEGNQFDALEIVCKVK